MSLLAESQKQLSLSDAGGLQELREDLRHDLALFRQADNVGSLLRPRLNAAQLTQLHDRLSAPADTGQLSLFNEERRKKARQAIAQAIPLAQLYDVVIANPPYMGNFNEHLKKFAKTHYPDSKSDLFAMFMERNLDLTRPNGLVAMINMQSWMFLSSYEKLREKLLNRYAIASMAHIGARGFDSIGGEVVSTTAFVLENAARPERKGVFVRLVDGRSEAEKAAALREAIQNPDCGYFYRAAAADFKKIPGSPIAYWVIGTPTKPPGTSPPCPCSPPGSPAQHCRHLRRPAPGVAGRHPGNAAPRRRKQPPLHPRLRPPRRTHPPSPPLRNHPHLQPPLPLQRQQKRKPNWRALLLADTLREFISYAVGCMFGRYSLDKPGLILANQGETVADYLQKVSGNLSFRRVFEEESFPSASAKDSSPAARNDMASGVSFPPDRDNAIPMLDGDWFSDDITERFKKFLRVTFGEAHYEENLAFIEAALGRDVRSYFLREFYDHHVKMYKKRPIYWLFSSAKGSFNVLIYMHRYRPDTVSIILNDYLREYRAKLTARKSHLEGVSVSPSATSRDKTQALKEVAAIQKILQELRDYEDDILYPLATQQLHIDLDDGVKVNYNKFGGALKKVVGLSG
jgi:hypothetical protein